MSRPFVEEQVFKGQDFSREPLEVATYEGCEFINCHFFRSDLSEIHFATCVFRDCDLSNATLRETAFREVRFVDCKLLGLHFDDCHTFLLEMRFSNCQLDMASFFRLSLPEIAFEHCSLKSVDFAETDLSKARFPECDLADATFDHSMLEGADFRSAYNYEIDPEANRIRKAKFSWPGIVGLLKKYEIEVK